MAGNFMLITGEPGSGRNYWNQSEAEKYMVETGKSVYVLPYKGFEIKNSKVVDLVKLNYMRKPSIYHIRIPDTIERLDLMQKYLPKLQDCMLIIPACKEYAEIITPMLMLRIDREIDVLVIRETVKELGRVTNVIPDLYRIHYDSHLAINQVYAQELASQIGQENAIAYLLAQWVVNKQSELNRQHENEVFHNGYCLYVMDGKIVLSIIKDEDERQAIKAMIISEGKTMITTRFNLNRTPEDLEEDLLTYIEL